MNRKEFMRLSFAGEELNAADITAYRGATIPAANASSFIHRQTVGAVRRSILTLGRVDASSAAGSLVLPTIAITDDGSTGHGSLEVLDFPEGVIVVWAVLPNIPVLVSGAWTVTSPVMSIGTVAAAADATLTSTEADVVLSTAISLSSRAGTFNVNPKVLGANQAITDSTTGVVSTTTTLVDVTGSPTQATINANFATLAARYNNAPKPLIFDGSSTAKKLFLNFAVNSDPASGQTVQLGNATTPGTIEVLWSTLGDV